jgi:hypothetical protein
VSAPPRAVNLGAAAGQAGAAGGSAASLISPRQGLQRELSLGAAALLGLKASDDEGMHPHDRRFLQFLEAHRGVINELVLRNPEVLMAPPYSVLLRYPSALEFRVKEAFLRRKMRSNAQQRRGNRIRLRISPRSHL